MKQKLHYQFHPPLNNKHERVQLYSQSTKNVACSDSGNLGRILQVVRSLRVEYEMRTGRVVPSRHIFQWRYLPRISMPRHNNRSRITKDFRSATCTRDESQHCVIRRVAISPHPLAPCRTQLHQQGLFLLIVTFRFSITTTLLWPTRARTNI